MRQFGARQFKFDIDKGTGSFLPKSGTTVGHATLTAAVKKSGFGLLWADFIIEGRLLRVERTKASVVLLIEARGTRDRFVLQSGSTKAARAVYAWVVKWAKKGGVEARIVGRASTNGKTTTVAVRDAKRLVKRR